jgi:hypothetical protein
VIIPPVKDRKEFYVEVINHCEASLADRKQNCEAYRRYYLQGSLGNQKSVMQNRLRDKVNLLASMLYAQETTKFGIKFSPHVPDEQRLYADKLREIVQDDWHDTDTDRSFGDAVTWSLVYGSQFKKVIWTNRGLETYPVAPQCLGVLREDTDRIAHQEAIAMTFYITRAELNRQLFNHPKREEILQTLAGAKKDESATIPEAVSRIIISQSSPSMIGSANVEGQGIRQDYSPRVEEELIECRELWIWDDSLRDGEGDYRVWTAAIPDVTIYDRKNFFMPQEHPFVKICPFGIYDYFWGFSLVGALVGLQDWRDKRLSQIDQVLVRQLKPSRFGFGLSQLPAEKVLAWDTPGGFQNFPSPAGKIETYTPELPQDAWKMIHDIDEQMNEIMGLTRTIQGRAEEGVRSEGHAQFLGRMALAPIRKPALLVEDAVEDEASLMLKLKAREDKRTYVADKDKDGTKKEFLLAQVSPDFRVKVSAHSSSPIFQEENRQVADALFKAGAIDKLTLVEMLDPPMIDTVLARLPKLEEAQAEMAKLQAAQEISKTQVNQAKAQASLAKVPGGLTQKAS